MPRPQVDSREHIAEWALTSVPGANVQATVTEAAQAAGIRIVIMGFSANFAGGTTAPAAASVTINVIDGASGGTTYLWRMTYSLAAVAGQNNPIHVPELHIAGTAATAMTVEFSAAGGANTLQSISAWGYTTRD